MKRESLKIILSIIVVAVLASLSVMQLAYINQISEKIEKLESQIASLEIPTPIVENKDSKITTWEYKKGDIDFERHQIDYTIKILPETIEEDTKVYAVLNDTYYPMTRNDLWYETTISFDIFDEINFSLIYVFETGDKKETEQMGSYSVQAPYEKYLPSISSTNSKFSYSYRNNQLSIDGDLKIEVPYFYDETGEFEKIEIVVEKNNQVIERKDITNDLQKQTNYAFGGASYSYKTKIDAKENEDDVHLYIEAVDEYGYIHKKTISSISSNKSVSAIFDANGNLKKNLDN